MQKGSRVTVVVQSTQIKQITQSPDSKYHLQRQAAISDTDTEETENFGSRIYLAPYLGFCCLEVCTLWRSMPGTAFDGSIWVAGGQIAGLGEAYSRKLM